MSFGHFIGLIISQYARSFNRVRWFFRGAGVSQGLTRRAFHMAHYAMLRLSAALFGSGDKDKGDFFLEKALQHAQRKTDTALFSSSPCVRPCDMVQYIRSHPSGERLNEWGLNLEQTRKKEHFLKWMRQSHLYNLLRRVRRDMDCFRPDREPMPRTVRMIRKDTRRDSFG